MRRLDREETGAVAVIVGILVVVLLGMVAIAVDVGALYLERRQLQNGADAAALAIAQDCTIGLSVPGCGDSTTRLATARTYADANAIDGKATVADGGVTVDTANQKITVTASTMDPSSADTSQLAHWFAPILTLVGADAEDVDATQVQAKGVAIFGSVGLSGDAHIPLTVGRCELEHWTADGFYFPTTTPQALDFGVAYPFPANWHQITDAGVATQKPPFKLEFQSGNPAQPAYCTPGEAGQNYPGGFGGLATDSTCTVHSVAGTVDGSEGQDLIKNNDCKNYCKNIPGSETDGYDCNADPLNILGKLIYLPIFESYNSTDKVYNLQQPAAFFVTSYNTVHFDGTATGHTNCQLSNTQPDCLEGYFTKAKVTPGGAVSVGGADTGIYSTQLVLE